METKSYLPAHPALNCTLEFGDKRTCVQSTTHTHCTSVIRCVCALLWECVVACLMMDLDNELPTFEEWQHSLLCAASICWTEGFWFLMCLPRSHLKCHTPKMGLGVAEIAFFMGCVWDEVMATKHINEVSVCHLMPFSSSHKW